SSGDKQRLLARYQSTVRLQLGQSLGGTEAASLHEGWGSRSGHSSTIHCLPPSIQILHSWNRKRHSCWQCFSCRRRSRDLQRGVRLRSSHNSEFPIRSIPPSWHLFKLTELPIRRVSEVLGYRPSISFEVAAHRTADWLRFTMGRLD